MYKSSIAFLIFIFLLYGITVFCQTGDSANADAAADTNYSIQPTQSVTIPFGIRQVSKSRVGRYLADPYYAYANDSAYWKRQPVEKPGMLIRVLTRKLFHWLVFFIVLALLLYGMYRLAVENDFSGFQWKNKNKIKNTLSDRETAEGVDYNFLIQKYQSEENYRYAVRYLYLRLLGTAVENKHVQIGESFTNAAIADAFQNKTYSTEFKYLAMAFEYVFYGGFTPDYLMYQNLRKKFDRFQEILSS